MDLFLAQEQARQRSSGIFTLAVCLMAGVVLSVHVLVVLISGTALADLQAQRSLAVWTLPISLTLLLVGVVVRMYALRLGGTSVARELGGRRLHPASDAPDEKLVLGMVEEIALSAGLPVPEVWILEEEDSINSFAVGTHASSAVIGITRGALDRLADEELRAVLMHEFCHILSGDMRLKFETLVWVQGILFISWIGRLMFASDSPVGRGFWGGKRLAKAASKGGRKRKSGTPEPLDGESQSRSALGILLMILGSVSSLFGRFLQGVISREREFEADAASAGFMASAAPVVSALRKIGGLPAHSYLTAPTASDSGHLFFSQAWAGILSVFFPTHPTLQDRILRLHPEWNGDFLASAPRAFGEETKTQGAAPGEDPDANLSAAAKAALAIGARKREKLKAKEAADALAPKGYPSGNLEFLGKSMMPSQLATAASMRRSLREEWVQKTLSLEGAKALLLEMMRPASDPTNSLATATPGQLLLLLDLAMPLLRRICPDEFYFLVRRCRKELLRVEDVDLVRFLLLHVARCRLGIVLGLRQIDHPIYEEVHSVWTECQVLITTMLRSGAPTSSARSAAHLAAWSSLGYENPPSPLEGLSVVDVVDALEACSDASPLLKKRILIACGLAASYQGIVPEKEMAVLRIFADAMGMPVPHLSTRRME